MDPESRQNEYRKEIARKISFITVCAVALFLLAVLSCSIGTGYGFLETYHTIIDHILGEEYTRASAEWWRDHYIWNNVMPSVVISIVAGAGLAIGGSVMQSMMGNPLADPYTTGISSGACLGAVTAIIMGFTFSSVSGEFGIVTNAFLCSLIPAFLVIAVSRYIGNSPSTMILIGIAMSYFFNALVTLLMISTDADTLQSAFIWQIGSVTGTSWSDVPIMLAVVVVAGIAVEAVSSKLNLLTLGDNSAKSLGLDVEGFRTVCLMVLSVLVASIISYTGIIGFIGLISPHIARFIIGGDNRFVVPASVMIGALTLSVANIVSRLLLPFGNVPIGVVMSFIGAPVFLYFVIRVRSSRMVF